MSNNLDPRIEKGQQNENDFLEDLTKLNNELVNLQRSVAKQNAQLGKLNEEKSLFLGMAVHDLRNPLGVIISLTELLLDDKKELSENHTTFIEMIQSTSKYMQNIVTGMLDLSAIEAGKLILNKSDQEINKLIEKNIILNQRLADKKKISINFKTSDPKASIFIDPDKIEQVLNNLISNAIKFSQEGKDINIDLATNNDHVTIAVKDYGIGIPQKSLQHLFSTVNKSLRRKGTAGEASTGLGLLISDKIIKAHKGSIHVESEEGKGTTFFVSLPAD